MRYVSRDDLRLASRRLLTTPRCSVRHERRSDRDGELAQGGDTHGAAHVANGVGFRLIVPFGALCKLPPGTAQTTADALLGVTRRLCKVYVFVLFLNDAR